MLSAATPAHWDWATISSIATAAGTLVLSVATFASVRSANRSARTAELSMLESLRPVLVTSRVHDPTEKIRFVDNRWLRVPGGGGQVEYHDETVYLAMSLRNVGRGLAVLHAWQVHVGLLRSSDPRPRADELRRLTRDIYIPHGENGLWQGALRDPSEPLHAELVQALKDGVDGLTVHLLFGDAEGGQRAITRFALTRHEADDGTVRWLASMARHWNLDRADPR